MAHAILLLLLLPLLASEGRRDPRAVVHIPAGNVTQPHAYPWMVSLRGWKHLCGGTLIRICKDCNKSDIVLTAAHCVVETINQDSGFYTKQLRSEGSITIVAGAHTSSWHEHNTTKVAVKSIVNYPGWDPLGPTGLKHDIAIIQTAQPIEFTDKIKAIDLDSLNVSVLQLEGAKCRVAGWGKIAPDVDTAELREMNATIVKGESCIAEHPETYYFYDDKWITCAESQNGGGTSCVGDSGGALVCESKIGPIAHGVVSAGGETCGDHKNTMYTTVRPHLWWIYATVYEKSLHADKDFLQNNLAPMKFK